MAEQNEVKCFFDEIKSAYEREGMNLFWDWEKLTSSGADLKGCVYFMAYSLSKNVLHGPLPDHLHSRMVFENNRWTKEYFKFVNPEQTSITHPLKRVGLFKPEGEH